MQETISSLQNTLMKKVRRLTEKSAARKEENLFVAEGARECSLLQQNNFQVQHFIVCSELFQPQKDYPIELDENTRYVTTEVYESVAYRGSTEGIIAIATPKNHSLSLLQLPAKPLILVLDGIEKPGNIGGMLRTCDAAAVDAVIICNAKADIYNSNVIRSSLGTVFTNQIAIGEEWQQVLGFLKQHGIATFAAHLGATNKHFECNFNQPSAILMGTESTGLPAEIIAECTEGLKIPMNGKIDSLNVSVSAGILVYEAIRQRLL
jgi:TrmH family RNA methyltransferase